MKKHFHLHYLFEILILTKYKAKFRAIVSLTTLQLNNISLPDLNSDLIRLLKTTTIPLLIIIDIAKLFCSILLTDFH